MNSVFLTFGLVNRGMAYLLGMAVLALAAGVAFTSLGPADVGAWALEIFGVTFLFLLSALVLMAFVCWVRLCDCPDDPGRRRIWAEAGLHAANGVSTLALTFTLLGISLGIGTLADQALTPQTIQVVVRDLTAQFSLAFMTTVVGLPVSAALRALIGITETRFNVAPSRQLTDPITFGETS
jgi:hypothetical protein